MKLAHTLKVPAAAFAAVAVLATVAGLAAAQSERRFPDVSAKHSDVTAIEWAADNGLTTGYDDGMFRPDEPLSFRHATVFLARYYEHVLEADVSDKFTRGDMMRLLWAMEGSPGATTESGGTAPDDQGSSESESSLEPEVPESESSLEPEIPELWTRVSPMSLPTQSFGFEQVFTLQMVDSDSRPVEVPIGEQLPAYSLTLRYFETGGTVGVECRYHHQWGYVSRCHAESNHRVNEIVLGGDGAASFLMVCHDPDEGTAGHRQTYQWRIEPRGDAPIVWPTSGQFVCAD